MAEALSSRPSLARRAPSRFKPIVDHSAPFVLALAIVVVWQIAVPLFHIPSLILPAPSDIVAMMVAQSKLLLGDTAVTLVEIVIGFAAAVAIGIPLALGIFYSPFFARTFYPLLVALQTVPKVALAPIFVMWFGFGALPKVAITFLIAFFPIVISTVVGLTGLDEDMVYLARSMGATEAQTFVKIRLPSALPSIFGGLKVAISLAVVGAVIGEYIASGSGLGYRQLQATSQFNPALNFAALVWISITGIVTFAAVQLAERYLVKS